MNGKKAKALRKQVFGKQSQENIYENINTLKKVLVSKIDVDDPTKNIYTNILKTTVKNKGLRKIYQDLKKV